MSRSWKVATGAVAVVAAGVAFAAFRPDTLFTDRVVDDELGAEVDAALAEATPADGPVEDDAPPTGSGADAADMAAASSPDDGPRVAARGEWQSLDHSTTGTVAIIESDGDRSLVFDDLQGDNGPDLFVYLSPAVPGPGADYLAGAVKVAGLKGNVGDHVYELPADLEVAAYRSVVIWCDRFSVGFGVAPLTATV